MCMASCASGVQGAWCWVRRDPCCSTASCPILSSIVLAMGNVTGGVVQGFHRCDGVRTACTRVPHSQAWGTLAVDLRACRLVTEAQLRWINSAILCNSRRYNKRDYSPSRPRDSTGRRRQADRLGTCVSGRVSTGLRGTLVPLHMIVYLLQRPATAAVYLDSKHPAYRSGWSQMLNLQPSGLMALPPLVPVLTPPLWGVARRQRCARR